MAILTLSCMHVHVEWCWAVDQQWRYPKWWYCSSKCNYSPPTCWSISQLCIFVASSISRFGWRIRYAFICVWRVLVAEPVSKFASALTKTVYSARKMLGQIGDSFSKLVCCPKCSSLYEIECVMKQRDGTQCLYICKISNQSMQISCGTQLMKTVRTYSGTTFLYPCMLFCYKSVVEILRKWAHESLLKHVNIGVIGELKMECMRTSMMGNYGKNFLPLMECPFSACHITMAFA